MKLHNNKENMEILISNISERTGVREEILEKDYYVTLLLKELTEKENQNYAYFKGGTALYKALKSIRRFSEDIDLTVYVDNLISSNQKQKHLKKVVLDFKVLEYNQKLVDKKGTIEVSYEYNPIFIPAVNDKLQRFGNVKIEATSFTISKPIDYIEIAPHLYELATQYEKQILEEVFEVYPFKIGTISLERIFIDKIFAAEFYFIRGNIIDLTKHIYDIVVLNKEEKIITLLTNKVGLNELIKYKRDEEKNRYGGIDENLKIKDFKLFKTLEFFNNKKFQKSLDLIHNVYVFNDNDKINIVEVIKTLYKLKNTFVEMVI